MQLDTVLTEAYLTLNASRRCSTEDITCDPDYREHFLSLVRSHTGEIKEAEILRRLSYLRKRSRLPRLRDKGTDNA